MNLNYQNHWLPGERAALTMPADLTVSQWAEAYREFPKDASFPGRWDPQKAVYAVEPMNAFIDPRVERITLMASARSVKTEIWMNMLGYVICQDPGPALVVMPTETKVKRICRRITKMIKSGPELRQYLTGNQDDLQKKSIVLKHMEIIFATAGSASDLGEFEARYVFESETDKYPESVGGYGSPTQMAEMRARTFFNRKIITESTPTLPKGFINKDYDRSDQRKFWVPCPYCGEYQVLDFFQLKHRGEKLMQWPKELRHPEYIMQTHPAVYECRYCGAEIEEVQKTQMLAAGVWAAEDDDSGAMQPVEITRHQGYWWNALYSAFATWQEVAAKFFEVREDREQLKTFYNEWLGLPWEERVEPRETFSLIEGESSLCTVNPPLEVPFGTVALTAGIDNQLRGFWVSIWAWVRTVSGFHEGHLLRYGWVSDEAELEKWVLEDVYHERESGLAFPVWRGALDTGGGQGESGEASLTEQAYEWLRLKGGNRIFGIKGASRRLEAGRKMQQRIIDRMPGGKPIVGGLRLWLLDTNALKDAFWSRVEAGRVFFHAETGEDFARQLTAEAKFYDHKKELWVWRQLGSQPNHYLDTAIYAAAMADPECWGGVKVLPQPPLPKLVSEGSEPGLNPVTGQPRGRFWR